MPKGIYLGKIELRVSQSAKQSAVLHGPFYLVDVNCAWKLIIHLVLDATFKSPSELLFRITIFPKENGNRVGGAAYVKDDPTNSTPKVFHIYPGKQVDDANQRLPFVEDEQFSYLCVYYGTRVDRTIPALRDGDQNIPKVVPWQHYASLGDEVARLEKENRELTSAAATSAKEIERLEKENRELKSAAATSAKEIERLEKENRELKSAAAKSEKEINRLKALAKAVVDAIEDLKNYDKNGTSTVDKNGPPNTDKDETSNAHDGSNSAV